jgi:hypothetical protein
MKIVDSENYIGIIIGKKVFEVYWNGPRESRVLRQWTQLDTIHPNFIVEATSEKLQQAIVGIFDD